MPVPRWGLPCGRHGWHPLDRTAQTGFLLLETYLTSWLNKMEVELSTLPPDSHTVSENTITLFLTLSPNLPGLVLEVASRAFSLPKGHKKEWPHAAPIFKLVFNRS